MPKYGNVTADYKPDIDYKTEAEDPKNEPDAQEEEGKKNFNEGGAKWSFLAMELLDSRSCTLKCKI